MKQLKSQIGTEVLTASAAVAVANGFGLGAALSNNGFHAAVEQAALLLDGAEANGNGRQRHSRHHGGGDLNQAIGEHRPLFAAAGLLVGGFLGHHR